MYKPDDEIIEGKYKIIKKLGNGAFGDIYRGKKKDLFIGKLREKELVTFMLRK